MTDKRIAMTLPINQSAIDMLRTVARVDIASSPDEDTMMGLLENTIGLVARGEGKVTERMINACPTLQVIGRPGAGYDSVDVAAATGRRIPLVYAPIGGFAVAEGALAMLLSLVDVAPWQPIDGVNFWPKVIAGDRAARDHVTVGWGPLVTVITDEWWYNASIWGEGELLYDVCQDRDLIHSLADNRPEVCQALRALAVEDAGGAIPEAFALYHDKPGCTPFEDRTSVHGALFKNK